MKLNYYAIEGGLYLIPTIEIIWERPERLGICLIWMNRDLTLWIKHEDEDDVDKKYSNRVDALSKEPVRCGYCLEPMVYDPYRDHTNPMVCKNPRCYTNLGYSEYDRRR